MNEDVKAADWQVEERRERVGLIPYDPGIELGFHRVLRTERDVGGKSQVANPDLDEEVAKVRRELEISSIK